MITFFCKISATVAGTTVASLQFDLPADMPSPIVFESQPINTLVVMGSGILATSANPTAISTPSQAKLFLNASGVFVVEISLATSVSVANGWCTIQYLAS